MKTDKSKILKKLTIFLGILFAIALCAGLSACKKSDYFSGFDVLVYYEPNGGQFQGDRNTFVVDAFRYDDFEADEDGYYHFKLKEPTDSTRPESPALTKTRSFCVGWYKTREPLLSPGGNPLDLDGNELVEVKGTYYVKGTEDLEDDKRVVGEPAYEYADRWDFENDELKFKREDGRQEIHLYAGWAPYFRFDYYAKNSGGEWEKYAETTIDYGAIKAGTDTEDLNKLWVPVWGDVEMNYSHKRLNNSIFTFPKPLGDCTFKAAYLDEDCNSAITEETVHIGTVNSENAKPENYVQNIYVDFYDYETFRISEAKQLSSHVNLNAHYEIYGDLDFTPSDVLWPSAFATAEFKGQFLAKDSDERVTIKGVSATASSGDSYGGIFGRIGAGATVKGITFEDAQLIIARTSNRQNCSFGLFAGDIDKNATIENIIIYGGEIGLGAIAKTTNYSLNMLVGGENKTGVQCGAKDITLYAFGENLIGGYRYLVDTAEVDSDGNVTITFPTSSSVTKPEDRTDITTWRQQNG